MAEIIENIKLNINNSISDEISAKVKTPIVDALINYQTNPCVPLHIPGHARGEGVLSKFEQLVGKNIINLDTTDEFDNLGTLHPADGPVEEAQKIASELYETKYSFFLVNGSTVGNLTIALTLTKPNQKVIVGRNCHRSVISGLVMSGAEPIWAIPDRLEDLGVWGAVKPECIEQLLNETPNTGMVWITNPTYEGIATDTQQIAEICKKYKVKLVVDEAHGSLWKFHDKLPVSALDLGADAVVNSLHKTAGSFSQSSILHIGKNSDIDIEEVTTNLRMLHSTSPSYLLLASLDAARAFISSPKGLQKVDDAVNNAEWLRNKLNKLNKVTCINPNDELNIDLTKIYLMVEGLSGIRLQKILEIEYKIEVEAATDNGILALSNIGNTFEEIEYFYNSIKSIVNSDYSDITHLENIKYMPFSVPEIILSPREAFMKKKERVSLKHSTGRISAEIIAECPPGIPILVPGEKITNEHIPYLSKKHKTVLVIKD